MWRTVAVAATGLCLAAPGPARAGRPSRVRIAAAEDAVARGYAGRGMLGMCLSAIDHGTSAIRCYGQEGPGSPTPPDPDTLFELGSVSKAFTGTLMGTELAAGTLRAGQRVRRLIPRDDARASYPRSLTVRELAQMYSGLPVQPPDDTIYSDDGVLGTAGNCFGTPGCATAPGSSYLYSNWGYAVLGVLLARRAGFQAQPFPGGPEADELPPWDAAVSAAVTGPLGMTATHTRQALAYLHPGLYERDAATGIDYRTGQPWDPNSRNGAPFIDPAGGEWSSARDMTRLLWWAMTGHVPASAGTAGAVLRRAHSYVFGPLRRTAFTYGKIGLGWYIRPYGPGALVSKGGNVNGFSAFIAFSATAHRGAVVLLNTDWRDSSQIQAYGVVCSLLRNLPPREPGRPCPFTERNDL